jgi:hypothetical protein
MLGRNFANRLRKGTSLSMMMIGVAREPIAACNRAV